MTTDNAPGANPMHTGERRRFDVPSTWIAEKTGYNRQGIYRMRLKGNRDKGPMPMERMTRMEKAFGWSQADQFAALSKGRWIEEFEKVVAEAYSKRELRNDLSEKARQELQDRREAAQKKGAASRARRKSREEGQ